MIQSNIIAKNIYWLFKVCSVIRTFLLYVAADPKADHHAVAGS